MATIHIKDYPVFMKIGCFEEEQLAGQDVLVCLKVHVGSLRDLASEDKIEKTVNYADILDLINKLLRNKSVALIEKAVVILGDEILEKFLLVESVEVSITKKRIPGGITKGATISVSESFEREGL